MYNAQALEEFSVFRQPQRTMHSPSVDSICHFCVCSALRHHALVVWKGLAKIKHVVCYRWCYKTETVGHKCFVCLAQVEQMRP